MDEAVLHELANRLGGRFRLAALVQKRLVQLMNERSSVVTEHSGGRPISIVVKEVAGAQLELVDSEGNVVAVLPEPLPGAEPAAESEEAEAGEAEDEEEPE
jgi:hypothetical protein